MKRTDVIDMINSVSGRLTDRINTLTRRHDALVQTVSRQGERIHELKTAELPGATATASAAPRGITELYDLVNSLTVRLKVTENAVIRLQQNPADKAWAGRVQTQLDQLRHADLDLRATDRKLSTRLEQHTVIAGDIAHRREQRIAALEDEVLAQEQGKTGSVGDLVVRVGALEIEREQARDRARTHWAAQRVVNEQLQDKVAKLGLIVELQKNVWATPKDAATWLQYELWQSATRDHPSKLMERTVVSDSALWLPPGYNWLGSYPLGYHWVIRDATDTIVAVAVNTTPPNSAEVRG